MKEIKTINSHNELIESIQDSEKSYLLLHRNGSEQSDCAYQNLKSVAANIDDIVLLAADVTNVRDIHPNYPVNSVPALLEFEKTTFKNVIKGCHDASYLKAYFDDAIYVAKAKKEGKVLKRVTVYTTPTCTWCNTLKKYLRKNNIRFKEVDVSRDEKAARAMVEKSGQQGVPQTDINGEMIIGFDQKRIDQLLDIK